MSNPLLWRQPLDNSSPFDKDFKQRLEDPTKFQVAMIWTFVLWYG
jgi:hypothetical protein